MENDVKNFIAEDAIWEILMDEEHPRHKLTKWLIKLDANSRKNYLVLDKDYFSTPEGFLGLLDKLTNAE